MSSFEGIFEQFSSALNSVISKKFSSELVTTHELFPCHGPTISGDIQGSLTFQSEYTLKLKLLTGMRSIITLLSSEQFEGRHASDGTKFSSAIIFTFFQKKNRIFLFKKVLLVLFSIKIAAKF